MAIRQALKIEAIAASIDKHLMAVLDMGGKKSPMRDTVTALVMTAFLENLLMTVLDNMFVSLKCGLCNECKKKERCKKYDAIFNESLDTFSSCSDVALRLGLISPEMRKNLATVGRIRNKIAHNPGLIDFDDKEISVWCGNLTFPRIPLPPEEKHFPNFPKRKDKKHGDIIDFAANQDSRGLFITCTMHLSAAINNMALAVKPLEAYEQGHDW